MSPQQLRALRCGRDRQPFNGHCRSQSDYGGLTCTLYSLQLIGYIDKEHRITNSGRKALEAAETKGGQSGRASIPKPVDSRSGSRSTDKQPPCQVQ